jgi:glycerol-3-phosphate acyltransferase PlsY
MSDETRTDPATPQSGASGQKPSAAAVAPQRQALLQLPGLVAISLYMLILAGVVILGVLGRQFQPLFLAFSPVFIAAGLGLLLLLRWAWAMTLAAVVLLACLFAWQFSTQHAFPFIVQGLLNLVFFLYLVRPEVREKLR